MYSQLLELIWKLYVEGSKDWNLEAEDIYEEIDQLLNRMEDSGFRWEPFSLSTRPKQSGIFLEIFQQIQCVLSLADAVLLLLLCIYWATSETFLAERSEAKFFLKFRLNLCSFLAQFRQVKSVKVSLRSVISKSQEPQVKQSKRNLPRKR